MLKEEVVGILNPMGNIEIIEFFDYNCIHCKKEAKVIKEFLKLRKDVKVILRPIPILGQKSMYATQIGNAILFYEPEKFLKYFDSLMSDFGTSTDPIYDAIKASGISTEKIKEILEKNKVEIHNMIKRDANLADINGVRGTPAFIINGELLPGAISIDVLNRKIAK